MIGTTLTYEEYIRHCSAKVKMDIDNGVINKAEDNKEESVPVSAEAEAAIKWVKSRVGQSIDYDGVYGAQCVDLIKAYYNYLGVSPVTGNGVDYTKNVLPNGWLRIQGVKPQKGDILVYTGDYGHVAIYSRIFE